MQRVENQAEKGPRFLGAKGLIFPLAGQPGLLTFCLSSPPQQCTSPTRNSGSVIKNPPANAGDAGDVGWIPGSGRFPWRRKWHPTPVFLPGKSYGAWWATVHGITKVGHDWGTQQQQSCEWVPSLPSRSHQHRLSGASLCPQAAPWCLFSWRPNFLLALSGLCVVSEAPQVHSWFWSRFLHGPPSTSRYHSASACLFCYLKQNYYPNSSSEKTETPKELVPRWLATTLLWACSRKCTIASWLPLSQVSWVLLMSDLLNLSTVGILEQISLCPVHPLSSVPCLHPPDTPTCPVVTAQTSLRQASVPSNKVVGFSK